MLRTILHFHNSSLKALEDVGLDKILSLPVREKIAKLKYLPEEDTGIVEAYIEVTNAFKSLGKISE
jgi:V/A-type H+-transporting ATPase subunit A